ncbi:hypothetical protein [Streptomyces sp. HUAS ZL42]|uniref:hypothetical protein n=1 Tax=Streptomyces sp. HUAS ZL42 TaxID=3231715 RepID=UPI00345EF1DB
MYEYELHQMRSAELRRRAEHDRLAREAVRHRRAARREAAERTAEHEAHTGRSRRHWFARVA